VDIRPLPPALPPAPPHAAPMQVGGGTGAAATRSKVVHARPHPAGVVLPASAASSLVARQQEDASRMFGKCTVPPSSRPLPLSGSSAESGHSSVTSLGGGGRGAPPAASTPDVPRAAGGGGGGAVSKQQAQKAFFVKRMPDLPPALVEVVMEAATRWLGERKPEALLTLSLSTLLPLVREAEGGDGRAAATDVQAVLSRVHDVVRSVFHKTGY
jgi:hypothetical protein